MGAGESAATDREQLYEQALRALSGLEASWKQNPRDRVALERYVSRLRDPLARLSQGENNAPVVDGARPRGTGVQQGTAAAPAGPVVRPADNVSPPDEVQKRKAATLNGTYLPGPPLRQGRPSLAGVSADWVRQQAKIAEESLAVITKLLAAEEDRSQEIGAEVRQLRATVTRMGQPPAKAPEVSPKQP